MVRFMEYTEKQHEQGVKAGGGAECPDDNVVTKCGEAFSGLGGVS